jgi:preprotein translocase subunit SecY
MIRAFTTAFKIPDLRGKILFTLSIIAVYRLGSFIPIPGPPPTAVLLKRRPCHGSISHAT